ncbi:hypothetical protein HYQ45_000419 [Verticillium longisporum]|uniref:Heterokaryon incompatibility domain-containing protein n=1 Tax=Verticillium longisporum TaxID=100787 RepID=A0A8I3A147_VERLO|nr:hypothetical protein VdG1_04333 [Verticillium dahliae VDG1]KAG7143337.1 hypothetical protein HYQ45_000419 [Verticillium longisporum]RBR00264.1 hypothetical protein VDGD_08019 [Verticillium dahliae]
MAAIDSQCTITGFEQDDATSIRIRQDELCQAIRGTASAAALPENVIQRLVSWGEPRNDGLTSRTVAEWELETKCLESDNTSKAIRSVALGVAILRRKGQDDQARPLYDIDLVWRLIQQGLSVDAGDSQIWRLSMSSHGFLGLKIYESDLDESQERVEIRVLLPGSQRVFSRPIRSEKLYTQSFVLASKGAICSYQVEETSDPSLATHRIGTSSGTKHHNQVLPAGNTGVMVRASPIPHDLHSHNAVYSIAAGAYHATIVPPEEFYATLCYQDSSRGSSQNAASLAPTGVEPRLTTRVPDGLTPALLARAIGATRSWFSRMRSGKKHARQAEWEGALRDFSYALSICDAFASFAHAKIYRCRVLKELGLANRCIGRYEQAMAFLQQGLVENGDEATQELIILSGELGVVTRHMGRLDEAQQAFQLQYDAAKKLQWQKPLCRAVGNLGMANFQLSQQRHDDRLLDLAITQLHERVQLAQHLGEVAADGVSPAKAASRRQLAVTWESIGQSRLSLCFAAQGNTQAAVDVAHAALKLSHTLEDPAVMALSRFFYGRALLFQGRVDEAMAQFNLPSACSCAIALCKEPSSENYEYLRELVDVGANMDLVDNQGYTALDHSVFNSDAAMKDLVLEGLRRQLGDHRQPEFARLQVEAKLRKGYRELFQEKLRPVLLSNGGDATNSLRSLRHTYDDSLSSDMERGRMFDRLKVLRYTEFLAFGRLPRSNDGLVLPLVSRSTLSHEPDTVDFVIFISYRWINTEKSRDSPDDVNNTQFGRMVAAVEAFLRLHPSVEPSRLGIWLDHSCVDQDDPMPGVSALPMIVAQCNAVISLVDGQYYERAWCSVEVMMVQQLRRAYGLHLWYEHIATQHGAWELREGALDMEIVMAEKKLTFESDRPKVLFLERQSKLLG